jgi:hypothetical protein
MSMIGNFRMSTDAEVRALLANPERISDTAFEATLALHGRFDKRYRQW